MLSLLVVSFYVNAQSANVEDVPCRLEASASPIGSIIDVSHDESVSVVCTRSMSIAVRSHRREWLKIAVEGGRPANIDHTLLPIDEAVQVESSDGATLIGQVRRVGFSMLAKGKQLPPKGGKTEMPTLLPGDEMTISAGSLPVDVIQFASGGTVFYSSAHPTGGYGSYAVTIPQGVPLNSTVEVALCQRGNDCLSSARVRVLRTGKAQPSASPRITSIPGEAVIPAPLGLYKYGVSAGAGWALMLRSFRHKKDGYLAGTGHSGVVFLAANPWVFRMGKSQREACASRNVFAGDQGRARADAIAANAAWRAPSGYSVEDREISAYKSHRAGKRKRKPVQLVDLHMLQCLEGGRDITSCVDSCTKEYPANEEACGYWAPGKSDIAMKDGFAPDVRMSTIVREDWSIGRATNCSRFLAPGFFIGYPFGLRGATVRMVDSAGDHIRGLGAPAKDLVTSYGAVGLSWTPSPLFAVLIGVAALAIEKPILDKDNKATALTSRTTSWNVMISVGGTLDIFPRLIR